MNLVQRVTDILLRPAATWTQVDHESTDVRSLYTHYIGILGAIPAIASFIGLSLIGVGGFGFSIRVPIVSGLVRLIVGYVVSMLMVFVLSLVVDALAPTFGGRKSGIAALKIVGYGGTAAFVGGVFSLLPSLSALGLLAALYSIYLIYVGLPVLMKCPAHKAAGYTATVVVCGLILGLTVGVLSAVVMPSPFRSPLAASIGSDEGVITASRSGANLGGAAESVVARIQEAAAKTQADPQSRDPAASVKALGEALGAVAGAQGGLIPVQDIKALLPTELMGMARLSLETNSGQAMGVGASTAHGAFASGDKRLDITITDAGGIGALAVMAGVAQVSGESEDEHHVARTFKDGSRTVHEESAKDGSRAELTVFLNNGVLVQATGQRIDLASLRSAVNAVNLDTIESIKRPGKG